MIAHALDIVKNEMAANFALYPASNGGFSISIGNISAITVSQIPEPNNQSDVIIGIVNLKEDKALKNLPNYVRNDVTLKASYENPPVFLNLLILITVINSNYNLALSALSRVIRFFQFKNVFTQESVAPGSLATFAQTEDQLDAFKLVMDLYSPSLEEVNHLWGTLGGKQYPFALYTMRMLDLKFKGPVLEGPLVTEIYSEFRNK